MAALAWLSAALALLPLLMAWGNLRRFTRPTLMAPEGTRVSIVIPARNEAAAISEAVQLALASVAVEVEVIVLDDDSTDDTADIVKRLAASDSRVRLIRAPPLTAGWAGKQRACFLASQHARFEVLMFIDADVRLGPTAAAWAAGRLLGDVRLGMVSGFPREITITPGEQLVVPWIHVLLLGYLPIGRMQTSTAPAYGAACGQWIIARRDAYAQVRGHAAAPSSLHDGISLPRTFRRAGWLTDLFDGRDLAACRMYTSFGTVWRGFAKSAGEGMATPAALPAWTVLIGAGHVLPILLLPIGIVSSAADVAWAGAVGVSANLALRLLLRTRLQQSLPGALLHPVGAVVVLAIQWVSLLRHLSGRPSQWRGRSYVRRRKPSHP